MGQQLSRWYWEATRRPCLLQLVTTSITRSTCQSAMSIIPSAGGIKMLWSWLDFSPSRKVNHISKLTRRLHWLGLNLSSNERTFLRWGISTVPSSTFSQFTLCDSSKPKTSHDSAWDRSLWRWTFPKDDIWAWSVYSRLRGAGAAGLHCSSLVCTVSPSQLYFWRTEC